MNTFPEITNISQINEAIALSNKLTKDDGQWKMKTKEYNLTYCSYRQSVNTSFPEPDTASTEQIAIQFKILREIRGLVFNSLDGSLVSRPLHKFFNVNETEYTKIDAIKKRHQGKRFWLLEKMDGQMIVPLIIAENDKNYLRFATKMGIESFSAKSVETFVYGGSVAPLDEPTETTRNNIVQFCTKWVSDGYTPVFEWCSPSAKIIIDYDTDRLILVALRHKQTGKYIPYEEMKQYAQDYDIECVKELQSNIDLSDQLIATLQNETKGIEGVVLRFEDDTMYKIKTKYYYELHKSKQHIQWNALSEGHVWILIMENKLDDVLPVLDLEETRQGLRDFSVRLWHAIDLKVQWLQNAIDKQRAEIDPNLNIIERKKTFVKYVNSRKNAEFSNVYDRSMLFFLFDEFEKGNESKDVVEEEVIRMLILRARKKISEARDILGDNQLIYIPQKTFFGERE
jgi:T4 RnlA family RNA ligase